MKSSMMSLFSVIFLFTLFFCISSSVSSKNTLSLMQYSTVHKVIDILLQTCDWCNDYSSVDPCAWNGLVFCRLDKTSNNTLIVTQLRLDRMGITNSSILPIACQIDSLEFLDLSSNSLSSIPDEFSTACANISSLTHIDLSSNRISGPLPSFNKGFTRLEFLSLYNNLLSGNIGENLRGLVGLRYLDLRSNSFTGLIPNYIGDLKQLRQLNLRKNKLFGDIPHEIGELSNLTSMDMSWNLLNGSIPHSISNLTNLEYLNLQGNNLIGSIPSNIVNMISLNELQLGKNHLGGSIPLMPRIIIILNLTNNLFEGTIPYAFNYLFSLRILDLSNNRISSTLEHAFGELGHYCLDYLDLSGNHFSGTIQLDGLDYCPDLSHLNFSYNLLSGPVPTQLQHFGYEAFTGNPDLCGEPLTNYCTNDTNINSTNDSIYQGLYISMGFGFYIGFWGVCGSLALKDSWRYALFKFVESIVNNVYVTIAIYVAKFRKNSHT